MSYENPEKKSGGMKWGIVAVVAAVVAIGAFAAVAMNTPGNVEQLQPDIGAGTPEIETPGLNETAPITPLEPGLNETEGETGGLIMQTYDVSIEEGSSLADSGKGFSPNEITVPVGGTVVWTNDDTLGHTVTSGNPGDINPGSEFDSGPVLIESGQTFEWTFDTAGEYQYFCQVHPWATGMVIVTEETVVEEEIPDEGIESGAGDNGVEPVPIPPGVNETSEEYNP